ncbi:DNA gyrase inhibitor YacG [Rhodocyclus tenuis]|uniref:DNA gyrase inhibitor YacG n=1 Tax=Rhodocyclus gracilis TaxID=2929842 RepID=A0ABX0WJK7_9RHOO|nr:DNA gyrase inhibitor YacG [Rhodocyclus gracilis]NJA89495.1 DNA gyrase inhibitor YacG [Rhodocyclus gracilis]
MSAPEPTSSVRRVRCPQCGEEAEWSPANRFRPFCSERCRMIDLGAWATESYRVPVQEVDGPDGELTSSSAD